MKTNIIIIYLLIVSSNLLAQNISYQSWVTQFRAFDVSCSSEVGDEEYTWYGYMRDNVYTAETSTGCYQRTANGSATATVSTGLRSRNNTTATSLIGRLRAWENDSGDRCNYDTGTLINNDDCLTNTSNSVSLSNPVEYMTPNKTFTVQSSSYSMSVTYWFRYTVTTIGNAVENNTTSFSTSGSDRPFWGSQGDWASDGMDCAASGTITHNQSSIFRTTVTDKSSVTFKWRVSSEANDYLQVFVNGALDEQISGSTSWSSKTINFTETNNTVEWMYVKNASGSSGEDRGFVDAISFEEATLSSNSNILDEVSIYPNPITSILNIKGLIGDDYNMDVYDLSGKKIKTILDIESKVDLSGLSHGFYMIRLYTEFSSKTFKILKK